MGHSCTASTGGGGGGGACGGAGVVALAAQLLPPKTGQAEVPAAGPCSCTLNSARAQHHAIALCIGFAHHQCYSELGTYANTEDLLSIPRGL